jgi:hypothetical protein
MSFRDCGCLLDAASSKMFVPQSHLRRSPSFTHLAWLVACLPCHNWRNIIIKITINPAFPYHIFKQPVEIILAKHLAPGGKGGGDSVFMWDSKLFSARTHIANVAADVS